MIYQVSLSQLVLLPLFLKLSSSSQEVQRTVTSVGEWSDSIIVTDRSGNIIRNETCLSSQIAILTRSEELKCEEKADIKKQTAEHCIFRDGSDYIEVFPRVCNDTNSASFTRLNINNYKKYDRNISMNCLESTRKQSNDIVFKMNCDEYTLQPGRMYQLSMHCFVMFLNVTYENTCIIITVGGKIEEHDSNIQTSVGPRANTTTMVATPSSTMATKTLTGTMKNQTNVTTIATMATIFVEKPKKEGGVTIGFPITDNPAIKSVKDSTNKKSNIMTSFQPTVAISTRQSNTTSTKQNDQTATNKTNKVLIYVIISSTVVLIILLSCLAYFCCCRKKTFVPEKPSDMESLYAKPQKFKKKDKEFKTTYFGSGYDEVGALIPGVYEERNEEIEDPNIFVDHDNNSSTENLHLKLLDPSSNTITDDPYEIIGRSNSFTPKRPHKQSQENVIDQNNSKENNESTPSIKPNGSIRLKQNRTSLRKGKFPENNSIRIHEDVTITPPRSALSSMNNIPNVLIIEPEDDLNKVNNKLKDIENSNDKLSTADNLSQKSNSYEEIWNLGGSGLGQNQNKSEEDSPYERIPSTSDNTNNKLPVEQETSGPQNLESKKTEDPDDSGYEEIWSGKKADPKTEEVEENCTSNSSSLNYPEVEIQPKANSDTPEKSEPQTNYIDVLIE